MPKSSGSAMRKHNVVVIKGDGIGPELIDASLVVLNAVQQRLDAFHVDIDFRDGGAGLYQRDGHNLAPETLDAIKLADATMKGPVGLPEVRFLDGTEAGVLGGVLRTGLDTYANDRPVRLLPGVNAPIKAKPGEIDYIIVRENTEGMYLARGKGIGTDDAVADTMLITRKGTERVVRHAFELASARQGAPSDGMHRVTCVDKSNVLASMAFFRRVFDEIADQYPSIEREYLYSDAAAQALVMQPQHFDVLVMENFLGDMLSDLGGGTIGGVGLCPSGNIGDNHAYFEPIHGSAPSIAGLDKANPISQILTLALMLDHLGERAAGDIIRDSVSYALESGIIKLNELGQPTKGTQKAAEAIAAAVATSGLG